jgi:TetR/AcrR family transcriptional regulator, regulator of cefoperazone and chloramphenicol sensitivity
MKRLPAAKARKRSRPPTGGYARGERARATIISAGIEVFAKYGFEPASTRMIAAKAGANLGSIQYYFGGKRQLYLACAHYITDQVSPRLDELTSMLAAMNPAEGSPADAYVEVLSRILDLAAERIIDGGRNGIWLMFVSREQMSPGPAFDILYEKVIQRLIALFSTLVGRIIGRPHDSEETILSTFVLLGPLFIFQRARSIALRALDWTDLDRQRMERVKAILVRQALHGLNASTDEPRRR